MLIRLARVSITKDRARKGKKGGKGEGGGGKTAPRHGERAACRLKFHAIHVFVNTALRDNVISGKEEIGVISIQPARWLDQDGALVRTMGGKIIIFFPISSLYGDLIFGEQYCFLL